MNIVEPKNKLEIKSIIFAKGGKEEMKEKKTNTKPIATIRLRLIALMIDYIVILVYGLGLWGISFLFKPFLTSLFTTSAGKAQLTGFVLITLPITLYFIILESSKLMGSIGKRKVGIAVTNNEGERISFPRSLIRNMIKFTPWELAHFAIWRLRLPTTFSDSFILGILIMVNVIILIYIILPFLNKDKKSLYDWAAGTKVVVNSPKQKRGRGNL
jgi:uncharacterized RDD family membrane protein YckC